MVESGKLHVPAAFSPGKEFPVSFGLGAGWSPEPVWTFWRRKKSFAPAGIELHFV